MSLCNCSNTTNNVIGNPKDYNTYIYTKDTLNESKAKRKLDFWNKKYIKASKQYVYLGQIASIHETLFSQNGNIEHLKKAENYYEKVLVEEDSSQVATLHSLSRNYISQHKFKECLPLLEKAITNGYKKEITNQILFDVYLELGNTTKAKHYLNLIKNPKDFNYLIRKAKWEDHKGNLNKAISFLEIASKKAEKEGNDYLKKWSYSNLGDFYGHQGNIEKSYLHYLKTLAIDPNNMYVLKGIAWIQYAHNKNVKEANRILDTILKRKETPDIYLFKAELAEYNNDSIFGAIYQNKFIELASKAEYGDMYNKSFIDIWANDAINQQKAIAIAKKEVKNRPTPQSYDLLAWCYYNKGFYKKALEITQNYVENKTFEPEALFHTTTIYKANNYKPSKIQGLKEELLEAAYELGPLTTKEIKKL